MSSIPRKKKYDQFSVYIISLSQTAVLAQESLKGWAGMQEGSFQRFRLPNQLTCFPTTTRHICISRDGNASDRLTSSMQQARKKLCQTCRDARRKTSLNLILTWDGLFVGCCLDSRMLVEEGIFIVPFIVNSFIHLLCVKWKGHGIPICCSIKIPTEVLWLRAN